MKIVIIGACGQVGYALWSEASRRGHEVFPFDREATLPGCGSLSLPSPGGLLPALRSIWPDWILCPAGLTWVDYCENHPQESREQNVDGPLQACEAARILSAGFVYYSTEYVFDGEHGPYGEDVAPHPLSVYGATKAEAEAAVRTSNSRHMILRTTVVYGPEPKGKNFVYQVLAAANFGKRLDVPEDQQSSPTYNGDLASATLDLVERGFFGTLHVAGPEILDRYQFGLAICRAFGLSPACLRPAATAELGQRAPRPLRAGLLATAAEKLLGWRFSTPLEGLASMRRALEEKV